MSETAAALNMCSAASIAEESSVVFSEDLQRSRKQSLLASTTTGGQATTGRSEVNSVTQGTTHEASDKGIDKINELILKKETGRASGVKTPTVSSASRP